MSVAWHKYSGIGLVFNIAVGCVAPAAIATVGSSEQGGDHVIWAVIDAEGNL